MTAWQVHRQRWISCTRCSLCKTRKNVVLAKGKVPCDVLFIGEAPGASEDVLGSPFVGPAGRMLDSIVDYALRGLRGADTLRLGYTNLVACMPLKDGAKQEPKKESIEACAPRLREFYKLCQPRLLVYVGDLAKEWAPKILFGEELTVVQRCMRVREVHIIHPAAILRQDVTRHGALGQIAAVAITEAVEELL